MYETADYKSTTLNLNNGMWCEHCRRHKHYLHLRLDWIALICRNIFIVFLKQFQLILLLCIALILRIVKVTAISDNLSSRVTFNIFFVFKKCFHTVQCWINKQTNKQRTANVCTKFHNCFHIHCIYFVSSTKHCVVKIKRHTNTAAKIGFQKMPWRWILTKPTYGKHK